MSWLPWVGSCSGARARLTVATAEHMRLSAAEAELALGCRDPALLARAVEYCLEPRGARVLDLAEVGRGGLRVDFKSVRGEEFA